MSLIASQFFFYNTRQTQNIIVLHIKQFTHRKNIPGNVFNVSFHFVKCLCQTFIVSSLVTKLCFFLVMYQIT